MSSLSCHVLNTTHGAPASKIRVSLYPFAMAQCLQQGETDQDGRFRFESSPLNKGTYTLRFDTEAYCLKQFGECFFPRVEIHFVVQDESHYHIPLLLSPYAYSTYRGS